MKRNEDDFLLFTGTIVVDTREQSPWPFVGLHADARDGRKPLIVRTVSGTLESGDYSLQGHEAIIAVERKSLVDLFQTLTRERQRFERELERLQQLRHSFVVVEADWGTIIDHPPPSTVVKPKVIFRSVIAFQQRFPGTHWWLCPGRAFAEVACFRIFERYLRDIQSEEKKEQRRQKRQQEHKGGQEQQPPLPLEPLRPAPSNEQPCGPG